jgi:spore coat protein U-like protein
MWIKQCIGLIALGLSCPNIWAGQISAKLNTQVVLVPSCMINNQSVNNQTTSLNLGQLDFGETNANFNGVIETNLTSGSSSGLVIQCSSNTTLRMTFGSGQNDNNVPSAFIGNYFRAVSNSKDYIAYNLLYGQNNQVIRPNETLSLTNNGQAQSLRFIGQAVNNGRVVSLGSYTDLIPVTIEF